jgi:predicted esterase YcpF (UPF0227 family)
MNRVTHLLYLHGFRSSPQSTKAQRLADLFHRQWPQVQWWCPQLPPSPAQAAALIDEGTRTWPSQSMAVIGSSLGGFYATWLAERRGCRAVLINPAVDPARDLARHIGEQTLWHQPAQTFFFQPHYVQELEALQIGALSHPQNYLALVATGDEVLDWREMRDRYRTSRLKIIEGSDHALSDFEQHLPALLGFLDLHMAPSA